MRAKPKIFLSAILALALLAGGVLLLRLTAPHENPLPFWSVAFSSDGRTVVTGGGGVGRPIGGMPGELIFWNVASGNRTVIQKPGSIRRVAWARDGSFVAIGTLSGTTTLVQPITGKPMVNLSPPNELLNGLAVSGDGKLIVTAGLDGAIGLWDNAGKELQTYRAANEAFVDVALSPDKEHLVATTRSGKAFVYDLAGGGEPSVLAACEGGINAECVAFAPDGKTFATGANTTLRVWELKSGVRILDSPATATINALVYTPNGESIAALDGEGRLSLLNSHTGELIKSTLAHNSTAFGLAISPDGKQIATVAREDFTLKLWSVPALELMKSFHRAKPVQR
jgi:WD40 repeat protein